MGLRISSESSILRVIVELRYAKDTFDWGIPRKVIVESSVVGDTTGYSVLPVCSSKLMLFANGTDGLQGLGHQHNEALCLQLLEG